LKLVEDIDEYWIFSLVGMDSRFRIFHGGYIGLSTWETSRRFTAQSAARELNRTILEPRRIHDLVENLSDLIQRPIGRADATSALREAGFEFNNETDMWRATPDDEADAL
jgi:hypothetical protein